MPDTARTQPVAAPPVARAVGTGNIGAGTEVRAGGRQDSGAGIGGGGTDSGPTGPAGPPAYGRTPGSSRKTLVIAVTAAVLAVGGGTLAWAMSRPPATALPPQHGSTSTARRTPGAPSAGTSAAGTAAGASSPALSPSPGLTSAAPGPSGAPRGLRAAPGVAGSAAAPQVEALLSSYFAAINGHDYQKYVSLLAPSLKQDLTAAQFQSGYGSTTDSSIVLKGISGTASGSVAATTTFTSRQLPADSPDGSSCDTWRITLFLQPDGDSYLIGSPPAGYHSSYRTCRGR